MNNTMNISHSISIGDRVAGLMVALALLIVGTGFMVLGVTLLPVIGILIAISAFGLAFHFLTQKAILNERMAGFLVPNDVMFHAGHGWARLGRKHIFTVGMDDFAAKLLGRADSISLPAQGSRVKQGAPGWQMKADSKSILMLSPIDGEVVQVNRDVIDSPDLAFNDPYGNGWLFRVRNFDSPEGSKNMVPAAGIRKWLEEIREALHSRQGMATAGLVQDGGEPVRGLAKAVDPQRWDELAREFLLTK
jgi:glycine cleavage system H lipoate-binding protein